MRHHGLHVSAKISLLAALLCGCLIGCGATDQYELGKFLATAQGPVGCSQYRVMPPDVIAIEARPTQEYEGLVIKIGPDGKAFLPLIGEFSLANKTTTQIAAELTENLRDYYEDVQVSVSVLEFRSQKYVVLGHVARPGVYPFTGNDTLVGAVAMAGPTRLAMPEKIKLIRGLHARPRLTPLEYDADGKIKDELQKVTINMMEMVRDGDISANVLLAANDVIYVPASPMAKIGLAIQSVLFPFRPAADVVSAPGSFIEGYQDSFRNNRTGSGTN